MTGDEVAEVAGMHRARRIAESFGADAARYDRARPGYLQEVIDRVLAGPGRHVLDIGAGTGIEVEKARFETWEPGERTFSSVVSGTACHWVDPLTSAREAASVLDSGGSLQLFWNVGDVPEDLRVIFSELYDRVALGPPLGSRLPTGTTDRDRDRTPLTVPSD